MSEEQKNEQVKEKFLMRTPPKSAFVMGVLVGISVISITAFAMTYSLLRSNITGNTNSGKVAGAATNVNTNTNTANTNTAPIVADITVKSTDHVRGEKNAKVTLVEYSDFECPYCGKVESTLEQLLTDYKGKIQLVYRHFPLTSIHDNAQKAAEASECANDQGKFWEMHDKLYQNQSALTIENLKKYAKDLGLNASKFNTCLDDGKYATLVQDQMTEGGNYGVTGTPATFVNGTLVSGAQPIANFKSVIDAALAAN